MMREATRRLREIEQYVEDLIAASFPGWRPTLPRARGWRFSSPDALDVYGTRGSPESLEAMRRAGFARVTAHPHDSRAPCGCGFRSAAQEPQPEPPEIRVEVDVEPDEPSKE